MKGKRPTPVRDTDERRRGNRANAGTAKRRPAETPTRKRSSAPERRPQRSAPQNAPTRRPTDGPARPKNASQAKARSKARKAKAPKVVRPPLRERLITRLASIEFSPRAMAARVPFVVLVIGALGVGLGLTLWLSTDAAERSYQLGHARELNQALLQQKEALERDVLEAQAAPALAESARELGMIPSRDTAHLVQDPAGAWMVVGTPRPAEGVPPPPLNTPLPDLTPAASSAPRQPPAAAPPAPRVVDPREVMVRLPAHQSQPAAVLPAPAPDLNPLPAPELVPAPEVPQSPLPAGMAAPEGMPIATDGLPHIASPQLPAQPGPVGGVEHVEQQLVPEIPVPGAPV